MQTISKKIAFVAATALFTKGARIAKGESLVDNTRGSTDIYAGNFDHYNVTVMPCNFTNSDATNATAINFVNSTNATMDAAYNATAAFNGTDVFYRTRSSLAMNATTTESAALRLSSLRAVTDGSSEEPTLDQMDFFTTVFTPRMMLNMNQTETVVNATTANTTGPWAQRFLQFQDSPKIWETLSAAAFSVVDFLRHGSELAAGSAPCIPCILQPLMAFNATATADSLAAGSCPIGVVADATESAAPKPVFSSF